MGCIEWFGNITVHLRVPKIFVAIAIAEGPISMQKNNNFVTVFSQRPVARSKRVYSISFFGDVGTRRHVDHRSGMMGPWRFQTVLVCMQ